MCLEVFAAGGLDEDFGVDDAEEGFGGEVAGLFAVEGREVRANRVVLVVLAPDVVIY
jgi:hypothetical protein